MGLLKNCRHWCRYHLTRNRFSQRLFRTEPPQLGPAQQRVVEALREQGVAQVDFHDLWPLDQQSVWTELDQLVQQFVAGEKVARGVRDYHADRRNEIFKNYIVRYIDQPSCESMHSPLLRFGLHSTILDVVNTYLGLYSKLNYVNLWYTIASGEDKARQASQRWHRDPEDTRLVKVFVYFNDVDQRAGPIEYIPDSRVGRRHAHLWRFAGGSGVGGYPPQEPIEHTVALADRRVLTGPRGTIVLCDTSSLHRGGFATSRERILATWAYVTPASLFARNYSIADQSPVLDEPSRYAVA